jgi:hypothetical protein
VNSELEAAFYRNCGLEARVNSIEAKVSSGATEVVAVSDPAAALDGAEDEGGGAAGWSPGRATGSDTDYDRLLDDVIAAPERHGVRAWSEQAMRVSAGLSAYGRLEVADVKWRELNAAHIAAMNEFDEAVEFSNSAWHRGEAIYEELVKARAEFDAAQKVYSDWATGSLHRTTEV